MMAENAIRYMQENLEQLNTARERAATNKNFQAASDDPVAANAALSLRSSLHANTAYLANAQATDAWMSATEMAMKTMVDLGTRAVNLALAGLSSSNEAQFFQGAAAQLDGILAQAIDVGNSEHHGDYLFSGFKTSTKPFAPDPASGSPASVSYNGNAGQMQRSLAPGESVVANVNGQVAFSDFYTALIAVRDAMAAGDLSGLQATIPGLKDALDTVARERSANGARQQQVQAAASRGEEAELTLKRLLSEKEDANMIEAITKLRQQETTYQAVLEVGNRTLATLNLFDLLR
jgi:flagellar hook-associated protein 3 FlgL